MAKSLKTKEKQRTFSRISHKERAIVENRHCVDKKTVSDIAKELGRSPSAASREIGGKPRIGGGEYSADIAQAKAEE